MESIDYQILFNQELDYAEEFSKLLLPILNGASTTQYTPEEVKEFIQIAYSKKIDERKYLVGIKILIELNEGVDSVLITFNKELTNKTEVITVFKYCDSTLFNLLNEYYKQIFDLEMRLREIISYIFIDTYKDNPYDLLRDINIDTKKNYEDKNLCNKVEEREKYLKKKMENEFFYLLFSDYIRTNEIKDSKISDIISLIKNSIDFESLKADINNRGIVEERYKDFLSGISEHLENLEKIRNCIAHNRTPSEKEKENYNRSIIEINQLIDDFLMKMKNNFVIDGERAT